MPAQVLVVDDSAVARRLITSAIERDPELRVCATARDGYEALDLVGRHHPDVVTLDVEMPGLDGLATLTELHRRQPRLPVLMVSSVTERGARITLEALSRGASDYVTKPNADLREAPLDWLAGELGPRLRALARRNPPAPLPVAERRAPSSGPPRLLLIAASTGGPEAITRVLPALAHPLPVPVVVVQHMPPFFTGVFAERLAAHCRVDVREAVDGQGLLPGTVRIAPGDHHLEIRADRSGLLTRLSKAPAENFCRPSADVSLRTAGEACGGRVLAVVLTGLGQDGKAGCAQLVQAGGRVLAQDEATSVVWGMPGAVARAGLAHRVLPLGDIAAEIGRQLPARPTVAAGLGAR